MTALTVMGYGCAASHRDWRRITLGSSGSPNQIGYIDLAPWGQPGFVWGSTNNRFVGTNRIMAIQTDSINVSSGALAELLIEGVYTAASFSCLELQKTDGTSQRYYFTDPGLIVGSLAAGGGFPARTQFDWNPPANAPHGVPLWTMSDLGKTVFVSLQ
jgi:hypothetical protein